jgi:hypothetical protein
MKSTLKLAAGQLPLCALILGLALTGCDTPSSGGGGGGGIINTQTTSKTYTGIDRDNKKVVIKIAGTEAAAKAAAAFQPATGYYYTVTYEGNIVDHGQITVRGNTITCQSTFDADKSFTITGNTISDITFTEGDAIGTTITIVQMMIDRESGGPSLTVNNLTGTFTFLEMYPNGSVPATRSAWEAIVGAGMVLCCDASDDSTSPFEVFRIFPDKTFNRSGSYALSIQAGDEFKIKTNVRFTNGSAVVDFSTMTDFFSLPEE